MLARLLERDDILETAWVGIVGSDLSVDLDQALGDNEGNLTASQSVLELVAEEDLESVFRQDYARLPNAAKRPTESGKDSRSL